MPSLISTPNWEPNTSLAFFVFVIWYFINIERSSNRAKESRTLAQPLIKSRVRIQLFSFFSIWVFLDVERSLDGTNIICRAWVQFQIQSWAQSWHFFFIRISFSAKKSLDGAKNILSSNSIPKLEPNLNLTYFALTKLLSTPKEA
jgi:hypothetical protein